MTPVPPEQTSCRLLVSIINYRTADLTMQCVRSVLDDMGDLDVLVAVVDNASGDGSSDTLTAWRETLPERDRVILVHSPTNTGFSGGHNQGMAAARAEYYLILNSDAVLRPGFLAAILRAADGTPEKGLFAPHIGYDTGEQQTSCFRFHNPANELIRSAASGPLTRLLHRFKVPLDLPPDEARIDWASFACILLRGRVVDEVGPMDTGYFLYFEDVEYCWRARRAGWRIAYVPEAQAVHFRGGSGPVKSLVSARKRLPRYYYASRTRMFRQFYGWAGLLLANLAWTAGRGLALARRLFGKPVPRTNAHEARDIWTNFLTPLGDSHAPKD